MEARIDVMPAKFSYDRGFFCMKVEFPSDYLYRGVVEVKNVAELEVAVKAAAAEVVDESAYISVGAVGRKIRGFNKFRDERKDLLEINLDKPSRYID